MRCIICKCCNKYYVGKTTQQTHSRMNQHRSCFMNYSKKLGKVKISQKDEDNYALGIHLYNEHNLTSKDQFDKALDLYILEVSQPRIIDVREHMWIHRLKSLTPVGLNLAPTFGIPLLS